jgi:hypothetical protein
VLVTFGSSVLLPGQILAQTQAITGADAVLRSSNIWRGQTRSGGWVLQPDLYVAVAGPKLSLTVAWWSTIELQSLSAEEGDIGLGEGWFGQSDLSLEGSADLAPLYLRGGFVRYAFADDAFGQTADAVSTSEIYLDAWASLGALVPRVPVLPSRDPIVGLYLTALAGWSLGQELDDSRLEEAAYFSDAGFTHLDLGIDIRVGGVRRYVSVELHFLVEKDEGAHASETGNSGDGWWFGLGASDAWVLGVF